MSNIGYIKYQAVLFGDFLNLDANPRLIKEILIDLDQFQFIPTTFSVPTVSEIANQRIALKSNSHLLDVQININRIDIVRANEIKGLEIINSDFSEVKRIFLVILKYFLEKSNVFGNRASFITEQMYSGYDLVEKYTSKPEYYNEKIIGEINYRIHTRLPGFDFGKGNEIINAITHIDKVENIIFTPAFSASGCIVKFDINTIPENRINRIDTNYLEMFFEKAFQIEQEISL